jgi:PPP family 3-phenylpropionic acid transporter
VPLLPVPIALRVYYFIAFGAMGLYIPYFPTWVRSRGFVGAEMGLLMATIPFCQLLSPAIVGLVADKFALRGRMMTLCAACTALGSSAFVIAALVLPEIPFFVAMSCMLAFAFLRSSIVGLADVLTMETVPDYGRMRLFGSMGFGVMALFGGHLVDPTHPYEVPLLVAALLWLLSVVSLLLPKNSSLPPRPALKDAKEFLLQPAYRNLLLTMMLVFGGLSAYDLCLTLRVRELGASGTQTGLFWSVATGAEVLMLIGAARLSEKWGPGKALTLCCVVAACRWFFLAKVTNLNLMLLAQPLHAISFGLLWVSAMGVLRREVGSKGTATAQGLFGSAIALGSVLGVSTWGPVYDAFGSEVVFLSAAGISAIAALSATRLIRLARPAQIAASPCVKCDPP